jgi:hypothetical protein
MASDQSTKAMADNTRFADPIPEFKLWRELGWFFKDGAAVAIER